MDHFLCRCWFLPHAYPSGSVAKKSAYNAGDTGSTPGSGRTLEKEMATHSPALVFFPGESHGQKSLADYTVRGVMKVGRALATKQ